MFKVRNVHKKCIGKNFYLRISLERIKILKNGFRHCNLRENLLIMMCHNTIFTLKKLYLFPIWRIQDGGQKRVPCQNEVLTIQQTEVVVPGQYREKCG